MTDTFSPAFRLRVAKMDLADAYRALRLSRKHEKIQYWLSEIEWIEKRIEDIKKMVENLK